MGITRRRVTGFTTIELLAVITIIAILAAITIVGYTSYTRRAASSATQSSVRSVGNAIASESLLDGKLLTSIPTDVPTSSDVIMTYFPQDSAHYSSLNSVQDGVLFHDICAKLIQNPVYSTIHAQSGGQTSNVVMSCDDSISANSLLITGWDSRTWSTPVTKNQLETYIDSVPVDTWWIDKQQVIKTFYSTLIAQFILSGGSFPITSFWDPWATQWSGVTKQSLPEPDDASSMRFCLQGINRKYSNVAFYVTADHLTPRQGTCSNSVS